MIHPSRMRRLFTSLALVAAVVGIAPLASAQQKPKGYDYYLTGSAADATPVAPPRTPTTVVMGGGPDVDAAFAWMIAKGGGGDFVVIRVRGADGYNQYVHDMGGVDSVETLVVKTRDAAGDPFVIDRINRAEAIFIAGGDQSDYITLWKGTPLDSALRAALARNVPIGGTSAGLAVLGEFDFAALNGTVYSDDALADPYDKRVSLDRGFLIAPGMTGAIADAHLDTRDRMGRLLTFLARIVQDRWATVEAARAIGVDVETALLIEAGVATRVGVGSAYFLKPLIAPTVCQPRTPLTFRNVSVQRMSGDGSFDLGRWRASNGATFGYDLSAEAGVLLSSQPGGGAY